MSATVAFDKWEKTIQKPSILFCNPGFPKCLGRNPGFSLHPKLRLFKVRFSLTVEQSGIRQYIDLFERAIAKHGMYESPFLVKFSKKKLIVLKSD